MKDRMIKILPLAFVVLAGTAGGVLRGMELTGCYDDVTGLYTSGPVTYVLLGFSAVIVLLCLLLALLKRSDARPYTELYACGVPGAMLCMLSGLVMLAAGVMRVPVFVQEGKYSNLLFGILTILCGISLIALAAARKQHRMPEMTGFGAVVTVFWGCFMLVLVFMEHPVEPVELLYLYDLLAMCFALLSIYGAAGQIFSRSCMRLTLFSSLSAVFLLLVSGFGRFMTFLVTGSTHYITQVAFRMVVYLALLLYCLSNAASLLINAGEESADDAEDEPNDEI